MSLLIDPTVMDPFIHLALSTTTGLYIGLDEIGETSIEVFGLNRDVCTQGRRMAWVALCALIRNYETTTAAAQAEILETCTKFPFQGVRRWLARLVAEGDRSEAIPRDVRMIVDRHGELLAQVAPSGRPAAVVTVAPSSTAPPKPIR
ncbi:hypothetical protein [Nocardia noduli]|uniref:hypothetical protein n=1 Tax=Nocardia noduli TaxID=2815722 RepID=UPI001C22B19D|nr:hypothetical protein [Nocardia noduli]